MERAYQWLRLNIAQGTLAPGSFVEEANVVEAIGVSRTPVREAFHRLAGERYLDLVPRRGAQVRQITSQDVREVYDVRKALEIFAATQICKNGLRLNPEVEDILRRMDDLRPLDDEGEALKYGTLDHEFHRSYVAADGNRLLVQLYDSIWPQQERLLWQTIRLLTPSALELVRAQHWEILAALRNRDADTATAMIEAHLRPIPGWRPLIG